MIKRNNSFYTRSRNLNKYVLYLFVCLERPTAVVTDTERGGRCEERTEGGKSPVIEMLLPFKMALTLVSIKLREQFEEQENLT